MGLPKIQWEKHGLVIKPNKKLWWMNSHAMLPTPQKITDSIYRIYFAGRNQYNQSHIGYAILDLREPNKILDISSQPILSPGRLGTFDDNGVLPSCVLSTKDSVLLYTIGFKPGGTTRMDLFGGLAVSHDNGLTFERWSEAPIIERCKSNPFINTAPWVVSVNNSYKMYYVAGVEWKNKDLPRYNIQIAYSTDGMQWERDGTVAIDFLNNENALARPYVTMQNNVYRMWFSSKGNYYLPQYAESEDGIHWVRHDQMIDLHPTPHGPDADMICYPVVLQYKEQHIMFYNGNNYGEDGICLAIGVET